jgi:hypothetical protein
MWGMGVILFTLLAGSTYSHLVRPVKGPLRYLQPDTLWDEPMECSPELDTQLANLSLMHSGTGWTRGHYVSPRPDPLWA